MDSYEKMQKLNETEKFKFKLYRTIECLRKYKPFHITQKTLKPILNITFFKTLIALENLERGNAEINYANMPTVINPLNASVALI